MKITVKLFTAVLCLLMCSCYVVDTYPSTVVAPTHRVVYGPTYVPTYNTSYVYRRSYYYPYYYRPKCNTYYYKKQYKKCK